ncbi:MAG: hypothetical protein Q9188_001733 [Gyalolechia gomerana]
MAEPLSITASVAGLVTLADVVFSRIFKYVQAVKGASKEISALSSEVGALHGILCNLHLVSRQLEAQLFSSAPRSHHIDACQLTLERLKAILDQDDTFSAQSQRVDRIKRNLRWPFTSSEVKTLLAEIERHKASLGLALNVDGVSGLLQSLSIQGTIRDTVNGIQLELKQKHEADTRIAISAKRQSILKSFGKTDPCKNLKMSLKLRQPGTGSWLIESQEFRDWCQMKNGKLWLYGIPGAGKTVLASTVVEEVLRGSSVNHAVAFFYCDYKDPATQKPHLILGSLIQQIAKQDEQSFEKVHTFCDRNNPEYEADYDYDCQELRDLILDITSCFDSATIIVDALDECGSNAVEVTELFVSLHPTDKETTIKTLVLSRNEEEIRQCLEGYAQVAIAARSSDLTLYVGAEIESRIRKNKLRIKDQSLKGYIMEKLVGGADGMTLRWIVYRVLERSLRTAALCEAVSINVGDTERDTGGTSDEHEILRWCSSLVRKSTDGDNLELAHFTVEEFLTQIGDDDEGEFAIFRIGVGHGDIELAKVCLTYLSFRDFDDVSYADKEVTRCRIQQYPLRKYAIIHWFDHAKNYLGDSEIFSLTKQLLNPSKPGIFLSWVQDLIGYWLRNSKILPLDKLDTLIAETTPLHFAAMIDFPELCVWLIEGGCDVNRNSIIGSPLYCYLAPPPLEPLIYGFRERSTGDRYQSVTRILLEAGADPNYYPKWSRGETSLLLLSLYERKWESATELLKKGAKLDEPSLTWLEKHSDDDSPD